MHTCDNKYISYLQAFRGKLGNVFIEYLIGGNVTSAEATVFTDKLTNAICTDTGLPACQFYQKRVYEVQDTPSPYLCFLPITVRCTPLKPASTLITPSLDPSRVMEAAQ